MPDPKEDRAARQDRAAREIRDRVEREFPGHSASEKLAVFNRRLLEWIDRRREEVR